MARSKTKPKKGSPKGPAEDAPADEADDSFRPGALVIDVALREGSLLARRAVERRLSRIGIGPERADRMAAGQGVGKRIVATALARLASRSLPGTILVGGGFVAKALYDLRRERRKERQAAKEPAE